MSKILKEMKKEILNTTLWVATLYRMRYIVKLCLSLGADVNVLFEDLVYKDKIQNEHRGSRYSLIHYAVFQKDLGLVKILLKHAPRLDSRNSCGYTPLVTALGLDNIDIVKALLNYLKGSKRSYGSCNQSFYSELACAFRNTNIDIYKEAISFGFDINTKYSSGKTPIYNILFSTFLNSDDKEEDLKRLKMLLNRYKVDWSVQTTIGKETPFEMLALSPHTNIEDIAILRNLINENKDK